MSKFKPGERVAVKDCMGSGEDEYGVYVEENGTHEGVRHVVVNFYPNFHHCGLDPIGKSEFSVDVKKVFKTNRKPIKRHSCTCKEGDE